MNGHSVLNDARAAERTSNKLGTSLDYTLKRPVAHFLSID